MTYMHPLQHQTRRHFFSRCSVGLGSIALSSLMAAPAPKMRNPLEPKKTHFPAKAKNVIFLFMAGGPSQLDLFEHKPQLTKLNGKPIPESYTAGKRFAFMDSSHRSDLGLWAFVSWRLWIIPAHLSRMSRLRAPRAS